MPFVTQKIQLNNGILILIIGSGAYSDTNIKDVKGWILAALKNGYRHIDIAQNYCLNKIPNQVLVKQQENPGFLVSESFNESLKNLGLDYIDLYLMHWPQPIVYEEGITTLPRNPDGSVAIDEGITFNDSWIEMEKLLDTGKVKAIGVSNFSAKTLEQLPKTAKVTPTTNQVELHPYLVQDDLRDYCKKGISLKAYSPSGYANVRSDPLVGEVAKKYSVSPNQVILAWHVARDVIIVPKSENNERQQENINLPILDAEDVKNISGLDRNERISNKADAQEKVYGWTYEQFGW